MKHVLTEFFLLSWAPYTVINVLWIRPPEVVGFQLEIIDSSNSLRFDNLSLALVIFFILLYPAAQVELDVNSGFFSGWNSI